MALALGDAYLKARRRSRRRPLRGPGDAPPSSPIARAAGTRGDGERRFARPRTQAAAIARGERQPTMLLLLADVQRTAGDLQGAPRHRRGGARAARARHRRLQGSDFLRGDILARMDRPEEAVARVPARDRELPAEPAGLREPGHRLLHPGAQRRRRRAVRADGAANPHRGAYELAAKTLETLEEKERRALARTRARGGADPITS